MTRLIMGEAEVDLSATKSLRSMELRAKNRGDTTSAMLSAGHYARKFGHTMYVYGGNSYGSAVWRVTDKPSEYLSPINNTGRVMFSVSPDLTVARHEMRHPDEVAHDDDLEPNASKLEWVKAAGVDRDGHNITWWKNKAAKWSRSEYDRPKVYIQVRAYDRAGQPARDRNAFPPEELKEAKAFAKDWTSTTGGTAVVEGRVEIPYQGDVTIELGEWRNTESNGYYVWSVEGKTQMPVVRRGPFADPDEAIQVAKAAAHAGSTYDEVVTFGGDPEAGDFEIVKAFKAWTAEVHHTTDLKKVGGRLREYR